MAFQFLNIEDFDTLIKTDIRKTVTGETDALLQECEKYAIQEMTSYLSTRYNIEDVFIEPPASASGVADERNKLIVMYCIDIVLYHVHSRIAPRQIPELRGIRYDSAITWLKMVAKGTLNPNLPLIETIEPNSSGSIIYQGFSKRSNNY